MHQAAAEVEEEGEQEEEVEEEVEEEAAAAAAAAAAVAAAVAEAPVAGARRQGAHAPPPQRSHAAAAMASSFRHLLCARSRGAPAAAAMRCAPLPRGAAGPRRSAGRR
jgi:hypothetical protein